MKSMTTNDLDNAIYNALPEGYNTTVTVDDNIKVTKDGSDYAMYIGWDETSEDVLNAAVYNESNPEEDELVEEGIYWDTDESGVTAESIAADIQKRI